MRTKVLKFNEKTGHLPSVGVVFCGNRAVASFRKRGESPSFHVDVFYGLFFWLRLSRAIRKSYKKGIK